MPAKLPRRSAAVISSRALRRHIATAVGSGRADAPPGGGHRDALGSSARTAASRLKRSPRLLRCTRAHRIRCRPHGSFEQHHWCCSPLSTAGLLTPGRGALQQNHWRGRCPADSLATVDSELFGHSSQARRKRSRNILRNPSCAKSLEYTVAGMVWEPAGSGRVSRACGRANLAFWTRAG